MKLLKKKDIQLCKFEDNYFIFIISFLKSGENIKACDGINDLLTTTTTSTTTNFVNNELATAVVDKDINNGQVDATSALLAASALVITTPDKAAVVGENIGDIVIETDGEAVSDNVQSVMPIPLGEFYLF